MGVDQQADKERRRMSKKDHQESESVGILGILDLCSESSTPVLPLYSFISPFQSPSLTQEEILMRRVLNDLNERQWARARTICDQMIDLARKKSQSSVPGNLLKVFADILEGRVERAIKVYEFALQDSSAVNYPLDFYILREIIIYLQQPGELAPDDLLSEDQKNETLWFFSPIANALYRSKFEASNSAIIELGQIADALINLSGNMRLMAVMLRAVQGNRLLERGEYVWAERVLKHAYHRAQKHVRFNVTLNNSISNDLQIAKDSIARISYQ